MCLFKVRCQGNKASAISVTPFFIVTLCTSPRLHVVKWWLHELRTYFYYTWYTGRWRRGMEVCSRKALDVVLREGGHYTCAFQHHSFAKVLSPGLPMDGKADHETLLQKNWANKETEHSPQWKSKNAFTQWRQGRIFFSCGWGSTGVHGYWHAIEHAWSDDDEFIILLFPQFISVTATHVPSSMSIPSCDCAETVDTSPRRLCLT